MKTEIKEMEEDEQEDQFNPLAQKKDTEMKPRKEASIWDSLKETFMLGTLNVILPTADVVTDLLMVMKLFRNNHPNWAGLLLVPFLLNYLLS